MADSQLLGILLLAMVAGVILFRLYTVLGRRTGNEREPQDRLRRVEAAAPAAAPEKALALPDRSATASPQADEPDALAQGLADIKRADRQFEAAHFMEGAREAYRRIVTAFAAHDRETLKSLLSDEVYGAFDTEIHGHQTGSETANDALVGFSDARIIHAELKGRTAEITVRFAAQFLSSPKDSAVEGDAKAIRDVVDIWTFNRDTRSSDPNWTLVATTTDG